MIQKSMKTTVNQRFDTMITSLGVTKNAFAKQIGVASTQIYNIIGGRNAPSFDLLSKIAITFPTVNLTWLLTGNGQPLLASDDSGNKGLNLLGKMKTLEDKLSDMSAKLNEREKMDEKAIVKAMKQLMTSKDKN